MNFLIYGMWQSCVEIEGYSVTYINRITAFKVPCCWTSIKGRAHMWQSRVEIEGYSVAYFDRIAAFEVPYHWTSVKGGAHMHFVDSSDIHASTLHVRALPLTEVQRYMALQTQQCAWNTRWNNLRFLHGTATYVLDIHASTKHVWALNRSSVIRHFKHSNASKYATVISFLHRTATYLLCIYPTLIVWCVLIISLERKYCLCLSGGVSCF